MRRLVASLASHHRTSTPRDAARWLLDEPRAALPCLLHGHDTFVSAGWRRVCRRCDTKTANGGGGTERG